MPSLPAAALRRSAARKIYSFTGTTTFGTLFHLLQACQTVFNHTRSIARTDRAAVH
jgi:hypothetical protein